MLYASLVSRQDMVVPRCHTQHCQPPNLPFICARGEFLIVPSGDKRLFRLTIRHRQWRTKDLEKGGGPAKAKFFFFAIFSNETTPKNKFLTGFDSFTPISPVRPPPHATGHRLPIWPIHQTCIRGNPRRSSGPQQASL